MVEKIKCALRDREQAVKGGILEGGGYIRRRKRGEREEGRGEKGRAEIKRDPER